MTEWSRENNKDYHFITVAETTTKNYGYRLVVTCSGELDVYMLMKSISQTKASYLVSSALNVGLTYWVKASVAMELTSINVAIAVFSKAEVTNVTEAIGVNIPIKINAESNSVLHTLQHVVSAHTAVLTVRGATTQATV